MTCCVTPGCENEPYPRFAYCRKCFEQNAQRPCRMIGCELLAEPFDVLCKRHRAMREARMAREARPRDGVWNRPR